MGPGGERAMARIGKTAATDAYFEAFRRARGVADADYDLTRFGDSPELADELLELVLSGVKRATAYLLRDVEAGVEDMGRVGAHVVALDGAGTPRCVWRTTDIAVKPLIEVDDAFARDEGEGDGSRAYWLAADREYFAREAARRGFAFDDRSPTVFERFTIVWPPERADV